MDTTKIGEAAAEMMEMISEAGYPEGSEVTDVMVIVCVHRPDREGRLINEKGIEVGNEMVDYICTNPRLLIHMGILQMAQEKASFGTSPSLPDEPDRDDD